LSISDIRPQEDKVTDLVVPQAVDDQISTDVPDAKGEQTLAAI
jgi:hypothetical protein